VSERECVCLRFSVEGLGFSGLVFRFTPCILHLVRVYGLGCVCERERVSE
jgi:hypothetical protein